MKNPIRNEASLVLVVAVILSALAIPVLSGFLEPSQPLAVAAAPQPAAPPPPAQSAPSAPSDDAAEDDGGEDGAGDDDGDD